MPGVLRACLFLVACLMLGGCQSTPAPAVASPSSATAIPAFTTSAPASQAASESTPTVQAEAPASTAIPTATAKPADIVTATPSLVPTAMLLTPMLPLPTASPAPKADQVISPANAASLTQVARFGKGRPLRAVWLPNGSLLIATTLGVYVYGKVGNTRPDLSFDIELGINPRAIAVDGTLFAFGNSEGGVTVLDLRSGKMLCALPGQLALGMEFVGALAVHANSGLVAFGDYRAGDTPVSVWDCANSRELWTLHGHTGGVMALAFSPDGAVLSSAGADNMVNLWSMTDGRQLHSVGGSRTYIVGLAFSPDGSQLATIADHGIVRVLDIVGGCEVRSYADGSSGRIVAFSPDGTLLASANSSGQIRIRDVASNDIVSTVSGPGLMSDLAFSLDGNKLAVVGEYVELYELAAMTSIGRLMPGALLEGHGSPVSAVAFARDGSLLVSGSLDGEVMVWDVKSRHLVRTFRSDGGSMARIAVSATDRVALAAIGRSDVPIWDISSGNKVMVIQPDWARGPKGRDLANGWDWLKKTKESQIRAVAFSRDGGKMAVIATPLTKVIEVNTGRELASLWPNGDRGQWDAAFSPNGLLLAIAEQDGYVRLWDTSTWTSVRTLRGHQFAARVAFSPDNRLIAVADSGAKVVKLWDVTAGTEIATFAGFRLSPQSLAFSPDGRLVAAGSTAEIKLWDIKAGREAVSLNADANRALTFSPDGKYLASGGHDSTVRLWGIP